MDLKVRYKATFLWLAFLQGSVLLALAVGVSAIFFVPACFVFLNFNMAHSLILVTSIFLFLLSVFSFVFIVDCWFGWYEETENDDDCFTQQLMKRENLFFEFWPWIYPIIVNAIAALIVLGEF